MKVYNFVKECTINKCGHMVVTRAGIEDNHYTLACENIILYYIILLSIAQDHSSIWVADGYCDHK